VSAAAGARPAEDNKGERKLSTITGINDHGEEATYQKGDKVKRLWEDALIRAR
jgi:hypothetical protein